MWILLIVLFAGHGISSEQMNFGTYQECLNAKKAIEAKFGLTDRVGSKCVCIEVDQ